MHKGLNLRFSIVCRAANNDSHQLHSVEELRMSKAQKGVRTAEASCQVVRDSSCATHNSRIDLPSARDGVR